MADGLIDQRRDVFVVQRVDDSSSVAFTDDQADVSQQPELMRHGGLLHADRVDQLGDRMRTASELGEDVHPARSGERLHGVSHSYSDLRSHLAPRSPTGNSVGHDDPSVANMSDYSLNKCSCHRLDTTEALELDLPDPPRVSSRAMNPTPALLIASAGVGFGHAILPDHWVPLAVLGRTRRYPLSKVARLSGLAGLAHVLISIVLGAVIIVVGLQFQSAVQSAQDTIIGCLLIATGLGFAAFETLGAGHTHEHPGHTREHEHHDSHQQGGIRGLAAIMVPFGAAASPDLTILPVFLAATTAGVATAIGSLVIFAAVTIGTIVGFTLTAAKGGYKIRGEWLERWGNAITAVVLVVIGVLVLTGAI